MAKSFASYTLYVTSLSPSTGRVIVSANVPSNIVDPLTHFTVLERPDTGQLQALWIEQEKITLIELTPTLKQKGRQLQGTGFTRILDVGLSDQGHVVISRKGGSSFVLKMDKANLPKVVWEFVDSVSFLKKYPNCF
jgi:ER membrane protein complex subunit 1